MESFMVKSWVKMYFFPILLHLIRSRWTAKKKSRSLVNNTYLCCNRYLIIVVFPYSKCKNPFSTHLCQLDECYDFNLISFYLVKCSRMCWRFFFFLLFFPPFLSSLWPSALNVLFSRVESRLVLMKTTARRNLLTPAVGSRKTNLISRSWFAQTAGRSFDLKAAQG